MIVEVKDSIAQTDFIIFGYARGVPSGSGFDSGLGVGYGNGIGDGIGFSSGNGYDFSSGDGYGFGSGNE